MHFLEGAGTQVFKKGCKIPNRMQNMGSVTKYVTLKIWHSDPPKCCLPLFHAIYILDDDSGNTNKTFCFLKLSKDVFGILKLSNIEPFWAKSRCKAETRG